MNKKSQSTRDGNQEGSRSQYGPAPYMPPGQYGEPSNDAASGGGIDFMRLVQVALRRWKTIVLALLLGGAIGMVYLHYQVPVYQTGALMEMSVRKPRIVSARAVMDEPGGDQTTIFNTRLAKFRSRAMREFIAARYLEKHPDSKRSVGQLVGFLSSSSWWSVKYRSYVVEVGVKGTDPEFIQEMANLSAECASLMMIKENRTSSDNAVSWLLSQAEQQKAVLATADKKIIDYRAQVSLDALKAQKEASEETQTTLNSQLAELEGTLVTQRSLLGYLRELTRNPGAVETIPATVLEQGQLNKCITDWRSARGEWETLQELYTDLHPKVKDAAAKVVRMRKRLDEYLSTLSGSVETGVRLYENQAKDILARIAQETRNSLNLETKIVQAEGQLNTMNREREAADSSYRSLLSRIEESRMAADENTAVLKLLQSAGRPGAPVSPDGKRILLKALLFGALLGYAIAWLLEVLEDKVTGIKDIERMNLDLLALLPRQKGSEREKLATICLEDKFSHLTEVFASVRTVLTYEEARERYRVILVTSTQPAEGKTVCACNLAISMAQSGRKTLLIDFDLRRPRLQAIFGAGQDGISLLHILEQRNFDVFDQLPIKCGREHLEIITSKASSEISPAEILGGDGPAALIAWAREHYDCVIVDTPPLGVVGDSQSLADYADGVILVAQPEYTRKRALRHTVERMMAVNTNVIGVILNNVQIRRLSSYSNSYHHYGSYHAYGMYREDEKKG